MLVTKHATIHVEYVSGRPMQIGEDEKRTYKDLECALDDCIMRSSINKIIVTKNFNKPADDPFDYYITIYD